MTTSLGQIQLETLKKYGTRNDGVTMSKSELVALLKATMNARTQEVAQEVLPKVQKFIDKVESGRARSKETYADMLAVRKFLSPEVKDDICPTCKIMYAKDPHTCFGFAPAVKDDSK